MEKNILDAWTDLISQSPRACAINEFIKKLPLHIRGTNIKPIFYASEVAALLNIENYENKLSKIDMFGISPSTAQLNTIMLSERGLYQLLFISMSKIGADFRSYVFDLLCATRNTDVDIIKSELENQENNRDIELAIRQLPRKVEKVFVFHTKNNTFYTPIFASKEDFIIYECVYIHYSANAITTHSRLLHAFAEIGAVNDCGLIMSDLPKIIAELNKID